MSAPALLAATGDVVMTKSLAEVSPDEAFRDLQEILRGCDVVLSSVELPFSHLGTPSDRVLNMRARPELVAELAELHLTVATVANNHSSDYGWVALDDTMNRLRGAGIAVIGAGSDLSEAQHPHVTTVGDRTVGILPWTCLLPLGTAAGPDRPGVSPIHIRTSWQVNGEFELEEPGVPPTIRTSVADPDRARVLAAVDRLRTEVDVLVVTIHWGFGFGTARAEYQQVLGHDLVDAGADLVLGHHVHAPQGVEVYRNGVIVYSPGNFVAQQPRDGTSPDIETICGSMSRDAFVTLVDLEGSIAVSLVPIVTNSDGLPTKAAPLDVARIGSVVVDDSRRLGTTVEILDDRLVVRR